MWPRFFSPFFPVPFSLLSLRSSPLLPTLARGSFPYGFLADPFWDSGISYFEKVLCKVTLGAVCKLSVDLVCGTSELDSRTIIDDRFVSHFPSGTSTKDVNHYEQLIDRTPDCFCEYNYDKEGNKNQCKFGSGLMKEVLVQVSHILLTPPPPPPPPPTTTTTHTHIHNVHTTDGSDPSPAFNLTGVTVPVALFHGTEDDLVNAKDYAKLVQGLPNATVVADKTYQGYSHLTWFVAVEDAAKSGVDWYLDDAAELLNKMPAVRSAERSAERSTERTREKKKGKVGNAEHSKRGQSGDGKHRKKGDKHGKKGMRHGKHRRSEHGEEGTS